MGNWAYEHGDAGAEMSISSSGSGVRITARYPQGVVASINIPADQVLVAVDAMLRYSGIGVEEAIRHLAARRGEDGPTDAGLPGFVGTMESVLAKGRTLAMLPTSLPPERVSETLEAVGRLVAAQAYPTVRPQRRRRMTRTLLREVADVYRSALAEGEAPTKAVASHFYIAHSTAARWVGQARKLGELAPAVGPTAGELATGDETDR
jgi:hypothetical protein